MSDDYIDFTNPVDKDEYQDELAMIQEAEAEAKRELQKEKQKDLFLFIHGRAE